MQQGCSTNAYRKYMCFDLATTLCYSHYPFKYISLHISCPNFFLNTTFSLSQTSNTRLSSFNLGTHQRSALQQIFQPYYTLIKKLLHTLKTMKFTGPTLIPTHYAGGTSNIIFTGWIGQWYLNSV